MLCQLLQAAASQAAPPEIVVRLSIANDEQHCCRRILLPDGQECTPNNEIKLFKALLTTMADFAALNSSVLVDDQLGAAGTTTWQLQCPPVYNCLQLARAPCCSSSGGCVPASGCKSPQVAHAAVHIVKCPAQRGTAQLTHLPHAFAAY